MTVVREIALFTAHGIADGPGVPPVRGFTRTIPLQHDMVFVVGTGTPSSFAKVKKGTHEFQMKLPEFLLPAG